MLYVITKWYRWDHYEYILFQFQTERVFTHTLLRVFPSLTAVHKRHEKAMKTEYYEYVYKISHQNISQAPLSMTLMYSTVLQIRESE